jgi:hypothetical protein
MLPKDFNYRSREWEQLSAVLATQLDTAVGNLCNTDCSPTRADQLRGRIFFIKELLLGEKAALKDRLNGGNLNDK